MDALRLPANDQELTEHAITDALGSARIRWNLKRHWSVTACDQQGVYRHLQLCERMATRRNLLGDNPGDIETLFQLEYGIHAYTH
jgi:hypothetical protein